MIINSLVKLDIGIIVPERECLALAHHLCSKMQSGDISSHPSFPPSMGSTLSCVFQFLIGPCHVQ